MLNGFFTQSSVAACSAVVLMIGAGSAFAQVPQSWTLESTAQRVLQVAPERGVAESEVMARQGGFQQAGLWPNPTIEIGASNAMGKDDGRGGTDLNQFSITQPLPINGRLGLQRKQADANLKQAQAKVSQQALLLEYEAAAVFHGLQFSRAQWDLTKQWLESADGFQYIGQRREKAGDLSRLARLRLDLVREAAKQEVASAEGEFSESLSDFKTLLNIMDDAPRLEALNYFPTLPRLIDLEAQLDTHPALIAAQQEVEAARHGVAMARAERFADPEIWVAHERDVLGDRRQNAISFGVAVTVPLWDRGGGNIDAAQANRQKAQFEVDALQRQLSNQLRLNHLHLAHLVEQGDEFRTRVLEPSKEIFQLSRKGFSAGQVEILNLVDAVDTHFNARVRYLELLKEAWLEAAALRRSAGLSLTHKGTAQ